MHISKKKYINSVFIDIQFIQYKTDIKKNIIYLFGTHRMLLNREVRHMKGLA